MPNLDDIEKQAAVLMGYTQQSIGKTQARKEFFPLVDALSTSSSVVEITDHDKPVAVLLSYQNYVALVAKLNMLTKASAQQPATNLMGSIRIKTNNLEAASQRVAARFSKSLDETAGKL
ncbi:MAG: Antitoxin [Cyanobacteriota bacterium erpe_2018_sw_21hr_WHONDRS-SW48-000092_B_bin.40]|jgi:prevent-host-death family protein|nr:Antitoxin [Cyanobacteriota bacterium erpe_2018_sw_21hr_WHONDRS-SW48-000092_B_bin.40]